MNAMRLFSVSLLLLLLFLVSAASATTVNVATAAALRQACESASAGDTIALAAGESPIAFFLLLFFSLLLVPLSFHSVFSWLPLVSALALCSF